MNDTKKVRARKIKGERKEKGERWRKKEERGRAEGWRLEKQMPFQVGKGLRGVNRIINNKVASRSFIVEDLHPFSISVFSLFK